MDLIVTPLNMIEKTPSSTSSAEDMMPHSRISSFYSQQIFISNKVLHR